MQPDHGEFIEGIAWHPLNHPFGVEHNCKRLYTEMLGKLVILLLEASYFESVGTHILAQSPSTNCYCLIVEEVGVVKVFIDLPIVVHPLKVILARPVSELFQYLACHSSLVVNLAWEFLKQDIFLQLSEQGIFFVKVDRVRRL